VAEGTPAQVLAGATVTVVRAPAWQAAFARLEAKGLDVALTGRDLRVPGAGPQTVRRALAGEGAAEPVAAEVSTAPASLEERFFQLVPHDEEASERT
jgi:hypothetical protein